jgi:hypothetical protein
MAAQHYQGGCHCGAVAYEADIDLGQGTIRCNCTLCSKTRAWFAFIPAGNFSLRKGEDALLDYRWTPPGKAEPNITYHSCSTCGLRTHAEGKGPDGSAMAAVFVATLEGADPDELAKSVRYVDGLHGQFNKPPEHTDAL